MALLTFAPYISAENINPSSAAATDCNLGREHYTKQGSIINTEFKLAITLPNSFKRERVISRTNLKWSRSQQVHTSSNKF